MKRVVQRTPDLGLTIKLRPIPAEVARLPLAAAPDPDPDPDPDPEPAGCEVSGVRWAELPAFVSGWRYANPFIEVGLDYLGVTAVASSASTKWSITMIGVALGAAVAGVRWEWSWDAAPTKGEAVKADGPLLWVEIPPGSRSNTYQRLLTANAYCGATLVGTLRLRVYSAPQW